MRVVLQLGVWVVCSILAGCRGDTGFGGDGGLDGDGGSPDESTRFYGTVWGTNEVCCGQPGSVDPIYLQLIQLSDGCGNTSPTIYVDGCEGYFDSGESYEFILEDGGCFRFLANDNSGLYQINSIFNVTGGESKLYDVIPVCPVWECPDTSL